MAGGYSGPSSADPIGGYLTNLTGAGKGTDTSDQIYNGISQGMTLGMGGNLFGDQNQPGLLGMGRYGVDPSGFGATATGAGSLYGLGGNANSRMNYDPTQANQARDQQQQLIQMLMAQANGTGPSVAQSQLRQASDQNVQQTAALMASQRGAGASASAYQAANAGGMAGQQLAGQMATMRLQEQLGAQNALGQVLGGMRGQDLNSSSLSMQNQQMNDQLVQFYMGQGLNTEQANRQAQVDLQKIKMQAYQGNSGGGSSGLSAIGGLISAL